MIVVSMGVGPHSEQRRSLTGSNARRSGSMPSNRSHPIHVSHTETVHRVESAYHGRSSEGGSRVVRAAPIVRDRGERLETLTTGVRVPVGGQGEGACGHHHLLMLVLGEDVRDLLRGRVLGRGAVVGQVREVLLYGEGLGVWGAVVRQTTGMRTRCRQMID